MHRFLLFTEMAEAPLLLGIGMCAALHKTVINEKYQDMTKYNL
jgi:hypothetical protein